MNKYITTDYQCAKCQKQYEFSVNSNIRGIKQFKCKHFLLKFILNLDNNITNYFASIKCLKCNKNKKNQIMIANNQSMKDFSPNNFICCENQMCFAAFFSGVNSESINDIMNNNIQFGRSNSDSKINMNNNIMNNNIMNSNIINNFNNPGNNNNFNFANNNMNNMNNVFNSVIQNNNMNNVQMMRSFNGFNCNDYIAVNPDVNQNFNIMNNQFQNINMGQNMLNNQIMNNNNFNNNMNNFQVNINQGYFPINNNPQFSQIINNNEQNYIMIHGAHRVYGETINFYFIFNQEKYPINNVKNTEIFQNVLEDFLSKNPDIKNKLGKKQKFSVNGNIVDVNKNLYDNEIRKDAKIIIQG